MNETTAKTETISAPIIATDAPLMKDSAFKDSVLKESVLRPVCCVCGLEKSKRELVSLDLLRPSLSESILEANPDATLESFICRTDLAVYRTHYVRNLLQAEHGELTELDRRVAESITLHDTLAEDTEREYEEDRTFGERLSDIIASFGGSWTFIIIFMVILFSWMIVQGLLGELAFDVYPYILLNLVLSCIAALQAPIIMMSQKRSEAKDRLRAENDYQVNLKAELEIRHLHEKMDHLLSRQWQRLAEIQQIQLEMMSDLTVRRPRKKVVITKKKRTEKKAKVSTPQTVPPAF